MSEHRTIKASEFKVRCLRLIGEVAEGGKEVVITKRGRPVSRLVAYREKPESLFGIDRGRIRLVGGRCRWAGRCRATTEVRRWRQPR